MHTPILPNAILPLVQAQPISNILCGLEATKVMRVEGIADMTPVDWAA
jgi:hypothetical protein